LSRRQIVPRPRRRARCIRSATIRINANGTTTTRRIGSWSVLSHGEVPEVQRHYSACSKPNAFKNDLWSRHIDTRWLPVLRGDDTASDQSSEDAPVKSSAPGSALILSITTPSGMNISSSSSSAITTTPVSTILNKLNSCGVSCKRSAALLQNGERRSGVSQPDRLAIFRRPSAISLDPDIFLKTIHTFSRRSWLCGCYHNNHSQVIAVPQWFLRFTNNLRTICDYWGASPAMIQSIQSSTRVIGAQGNEGDSGQRSTL
jgi:hypothetical protein